MARWLRARLTFANVVALIALFVALGGPAWALQGVNTVFSDDIVNGEVRSLDILNGGVTIADLADGSVGAGEVVNGALTGAELADGTVSGADVTNGSLEGTDVEDRSLSGEDLAEGSVTGSEVAESTLGQVPSAGVAAHATTIADDSVTASSLGVITRRIGTVVVPGNSPENGNYLLKDVTVTCASGEIAIGWEAYWTIGHIPGDNDELFISQVVIVQNSSQVPFGAHVTGGNDTADNTTLLVAVYCLAP
jgi:hypothetical protein